MNNHIVKYVFGLFFLVVLISDACSRSAVKPLAPADSTGVTQPALSGRLLFHSYSCYSCNDSKLYLYDFAARTLSVLSNGWAISNTMNAHFSPGGKSIVFMGTPQASDNWDVFIWRIGSATQPVNLTSKFGTSRDEDPKFSTDGSKIIFKQNGQMKEMDTLGNILNSISVAQREASMPYYVKGDTSVLYAGNEATGTTADIYRVSLITGFVYALSSLASVEEYYPIARDDTSFLFTRWYSSANHNDQVYMGYLNGKTSLRLPFNESDQNYSDAFPVNHQYVILSSTRPGGKGSYDLYLADILTGERWSLSSYHVGINSTGNELGACYSSK